MTTPRTAAARGGGEQGQATVELAGALVVVAVLMVVVARVGVVVRDELAVQLAAREGARAAAVAADPAGAATRAATGAVSLPVNVQTVVGATTVTVTATYRDEGGASPIARALGVVTHRASATMLLEPP